MVSRPMYCVHNINKTIQHYLKELCRVGLGLYNLISIEHSLKVEKGTFGLNKFATRKGTLGKDVYTPKNWNYIETLLTFDNSHDSWFCTTVGIKILK